MPILGAITGGLDFSNYFLPLSKEVTASSLADAKKQGAVLGWGNFLTVALNFLIVAWALFLAIKGINRLRQEPPQPSAPTPPPRQEALLQEIRDLLAKRSVT
jgi:large conductance mechanosensitive channel